MLYDKRQKSFWQDLADLMQLSTEQPECEEAIQFIQYLIRKKQPLPKRLLWELQQTKRIEIAEILFFLYKKYLLYRTKTVKCKCGTNNIVNNFYQTPCCYCKKMLGKTRT